MIKLDIQKPLQGARGEMLLDVNLQIKKGEFVLLTGQSGSGKTTLLRILAGLEKAKGTIKVDDNIWQDDKHFLPPQKRKIGFVFQHYALFPHLSVLENLLFIADDKDLAQNLLDKVELTSLQHQRPHELSGGQQQRIALARALMHRPKILLLDEPLSALDSDLRLKLQDDITSLHQEFGMTTIMISHHLSEIYRLAHRVIMIKEGKVIQDGSPKTLYLNTKKVLKAQVIEVLEESLIVSIGDRLLRIDRERRDIKVGMSIDVPLS